MMTQRHPDWGLIFGPKGSKVKVKTGRNFPVLVCDCSITALYRHSPDGATVCCRPPRALILIKTLFTYLLTYLLT